MIGAIDSASFYEVVAALSFAHPNDCYGWAWTSARAVTQSLMFTHHLTMSPGPPAARGEKLGLPSGPYGRLVEDLAGIVAPPTAPPASLVTQALKETKAWATDHPASVRNALAKLKAQDDFPKWWDWVRGNALEENVLRMDGLFSRGLIPQIALVLKSDIPTITDVHRASRDLTLMRQMAVSGNAPELLLDSYMTAALLRGRYHDTVARAAHWQVLHHQLREFALPAIRRQSTTVVPVRSQLLLSNIVLANAFAEKGIERRIRRWADDLSRARRPALSTGRLSRDPATESAAREEAKAAAVEFGVVRNSRWMGPAANFAELGAGGVVALMLTGWPGAAVGGAVTISGFAADRVGRHHRRARLDRLVNAGPGRITMAVV